MLSETLPALRRAEQCFATAAGVEILVLSAFGDESADKKGQRVFAVAAVIGTEDGWLGAKRAWLDRTGGKIFHASTCESEFARDPDKSKHKANLRLYADLATIVANSELAGYGTALDLMAFRECFPGALNDAGYYKCFTEVIRHTAEAAMKTRAQIEYTFHHRQPSEYNAGALYDLLVNRAEWQPNLFMRTKVSFEGDIKNPCIQIADLVDRETMKWLDREIISQPARKSMNALAASGAFIFRSLDRKYCEDWRDAMLLMKAEVGFDDQEYLEWLRSGGRVDNWSNRIGYAVWLQNKGLLS